MSGADPVVILQAVRVRGAVIEAAASNLLGSPAVALLIRPDASVAVVATMEQIFGAKYQVVGLSLIHISEPTRPY